MTVIYSSDLFMYNAKYFRTLSREKRRSFANCCVIDNIETQLIRHISLCYVNKKIRLQYTEIVLKHVF